MSNASATAVAVSFIHLFIPVIKQKRITEKNRVICET